MNKYKVCLVSKRYNLKECINFVETFSFVLLKDSFKIIMMLVVYVNFELHQMDVKIMFSMVTLKKQLKNFGLLYNHRIVSYDTKSMICKLKKSIYKLKWVSHQ